jgi:hypothetical protein
LIKTASVIKVIQGWNFRSALGAKKRRPRLSVERRATKIKDCKAGRRNERSFRRVFLALTQ